MSPLPLPLALALPLALLAGTVDASIYFAPSDSPDHTFEEILGTFEHPFPFSAELLDGLFESDRVQGADIFFHPGEYFHSHRVSLSSHAAVRGLGPPQDVVFRCGDFRNYAFALAATGAAPTSWSVGNMTFIGCTNVIHTVNDQFGVYLSDIVVVGLADTSDIISTSLPAAFEFGTQDSVRMERIVVDRFLGSAFVIRQCNFMIDDLIVINTLTGTAPGLAIDTNSVVAITNAIFYNNTALVAHMAVSALTSTITMDRVIFADSEAPQTGPINAATCNLQIRNSVFLNNIVYDTFATGAVLYMVGNNRGSDFSADNLFFQDNQFVLRALATATVIAVEGAAGGLSGLTFHDSSLHYNEYLESHMLIQVSSEDPVTIQGVLAYEVRPTTILQSWISLRGSVIDYTVVDSADFRLQRAQARAFSDMVTTTRFTNGLVQNCTGTLLFSDADSVIFDGLRVRDSIFSSVVAVEDAALVSINNISVVDCAVAIVAQVDRVELVTVSDLFISNLVGTLMRMTGSTLSISGAQVHRVRGPFALSALAMYLYVVSSTVAITDSVFDDGHGLPAFHLATGNVANAMTLDNVTVRNVTAELATAGILMSGFRLLIQNSHFENTAGRLPVVTARTDQLAIVGSEFVNNRVQIGEQSLGGAVDAQTASLIVSESEFVDSEGMRGGGISYIGCSALVSRSTFRGTRAVADGGGIYFDNQACLNDEEERLQVQDTRFEQTVATRGGAIFSELPGVQVSRAEYVDVTASLYGTGVATNAAELVVDPASVTASPGGTTPEFSVSVLDAFGEKVRVSPGSEPLVVLRAPCLEVVRNGSLASGQFESGFGVVAVDGVARFPPATVLVEDVDLAVGEEFQIEFVVGGLTSAYVSLTIAPCEDGEAVIEQTAGGCAGESLEICQQCVSGTFSDAFGEPCRLCTDALVCSGGVSEVAAGYWRPAGSLDAPLLCQIGEACEGGATAECRSGHRGPLCGSCESGYTQFTGLCAKCPDTGPSVLVLVASVVVVVILMVWLISSSRRKKSQQAVVLKVLITYLQMVAVFSSFDVEWPNVTETIFNGASSTNMTTVFSSFRCLLGWSALEIGVAVMLLPVLAVLVVVVVHAVRYGPAEMRARGTHGLQSIAMDLAVILIFLHPGITKAVLESIPCIDIENVGRVLRSDTSVSCESSGGSALVLTSTVFMAIYCVGPCVALLGILFWHKTMRHSFAEKVMHGHADALGFRFATSGYRPAAFWWDSTVLLRKIVWVTIATLTSGAEQLTLGMLLLLGSLVVTISVRPYNSVIADRLDRLTMFLLYTSLWIAGLFRLDGDLASSDNGIVLGTVLLVAHFVTIVSFLRYTPLAPLAQAAWRRILGARPTRIAANGGGLVGLQVEGQQQN